MKNTKFESIYNAVKYWKAKGLDPLPIPPVDGHPAKGPRTKDWHIAAAKGHSPEDFNDSCNIGVLLGGPKNLVDIDADSLIAVAMAKEVFREKNLDTLAFGRKSKPEAHHFFYGDVPVLSLEIVDPHDREMIVELRSLNKDGSRGHQTVVPSSIRFDPKTGVEERIEIQSASEDIRAVSSRELIQTVRYIGAASLLAKHFPVCSNRHTAILSLAGVFARAGKPEGLATRFIDLAYRHSFGYNNDSEKVTTDVRDVYRKLSASPEASLYGYPTLVQIVPKVVADKMLELLDIQRSEPVSPSANSDNAYPLTDSGNAQWLVDTFGGELRYCVDAATWLTYDSLRGLWVEGDIPVRELAKKRGHALRQQAALLKKPELTDDEDVDRKAKKRCLDQQKAITTAANRAENSEGIRGMLFAALSNPQIACSRSQFDQHHQLLNVANGVLDLYTGELLPHDAKYLFTKYCPTEYHPGSKHHVWEDTLAAITRKHSDVAPFLQVLAGYSAQGNKIEERIPAFYGRGGSGKGTLIEAVSSTLGEDYVCAVAPETVLKQNRNSAAASGDIARLEGKRIVIVSELEKGNRLQEGLLKAMSGNDAVVARHLHKAERQFRPTWQFWFQTNNRLGFDSTDSGNKRRFIEVPFYNVLSEDPLVKFDRNLKSWMRTDKDFHQAVLAWIVEGCIRWRNEGLKIPDSVRKATDELFAANDFLREFITERCVVKPKAKVLVSEMTLEYVSYCKQQGEEPAKGRTFNRMLKERGYEYKQTKMAGGNLKAWHGIRLKTAKEMRPPVVPKKPMGSATSLDAVLGEEEDVA